MGLKSRYFGRRVPEQRNAKVADAENRQIQQTLGLYDTGHRRPAPTAVTLPGHDFLPFRTSSHEFSPRNRFRPRWDHRPRLRWLNRALACQARQALVRYSRLRWDRSIGGHLGSPLLRPRASVLPLELVPSTQDVYNAGRIVRIPYRRNC
jgi:hypothetical protein